MKSLTVAFITGRKEPHLPWVLEGLRRQSRPGESIHLLVIDAAGRSFNQLVGFDDDKTYDTIWAWYAPALHRVTCVAPKPTIWQGPHRITKQDWWAKSSALNTAFALCDTEWIACIDDRCRLGEGWLDAVRRAMDGEYVLCGGYEKRHGMDAGEGTRVAIDNRFEAVPDGHPHCAGQWLYGCSFALPLEWALAINGFEEGCDGLSAEDYIFGLMLANAGYRLDYDPKMWVIQDRSPGQDNAYRREDKGVSPNDKSHAALARFGSRKATEFTPYLRQLRSRLRAMPYLGWPTPDPTYDYRDWYDNMLIRDFPGPGETFP